MVILGHNDVTLDGCNYLLQNYMQRHIDYTLFQTYMKWLETFIQSKLKFNYHMTLLLFSRLHHVIHSSSYRSDHFMRNLKKKLLLYFKECLRVFRVKETLWWFRLKDLSIDEMIGAWYFGCLSGPLGFTCWISFAPVFGFIYCWVLIFALSPCYILIYMF